MMKHAYCILFAALAAILFSCTAPDRDRFREDAIAALEVFGDAAMRLEGTRLLQEKAPALLPLIDQPMLVEGREPMPRDGQVSLAEAVAFVRRADAAQVVLITLALAQRSPR